MTETLTRLWLCFYCHDTSVCRERHPPRTGYRIRGEHVPDGENKCEGCGTPNAQITYLCPHPPLSPERLKR